MTTCRSRCAVSCRSRFVAVYPPTFAAASGTACTLSRNARTVAVARGESGAASIVTEMSTCPSTCFGGGAGWPAFCRSKASSGSTYARAFVTPGTLSAACTTASSRPAFATTSTGVADASEKCRLSTSCPALESTGARNELVRGTPCASSRAVPRASPPSASTVSTHTSRLCRPIPAASRDQKPRSPVAADPYAGRNGQNAHRPVSASTAGSSTSMDTSAQAMPTAATGPRPRVEPRSEASRQSRARMTVEPLATIGCTTPRHAAEIAVYRSRRRRSSSRYRAVNSNA